MIGQGNVTHLLVGKDLNALASTSTRADLATGQIGVFKVGSKTAMGTSGSLAAGDKFTIATKNSKGVIVETPVMEYSNIKSKSATAYDAPAVRSRAIGFNGTSGSIDPINYANYVAHVFWKDNSKTFGQGILVKFAAYAADGSATQAEIATGLAGNFNKNFKREKPKLIKAEVLLSNAGAANAATAGADFSHLKFTNGSKYVIGTNGSNVPMLGSDEAIDTIVAGDYLRAGTAVTSPCYKIESVIAGTGATPAGTSVIIVLVEPFQGDTAEIAVASTEYITAALAAASDAGVKLTGMPLTEGFEPGIVRWDFIDFEIQLGSEVGATTQSAADGVNSLTNPSIGSGSYYEVAQNEWFLKGNRGEAWRVGNYPKNITLEATSGKTYDQVTINYATTNAQTIDRQVASYGTVMIATEVTGGGGVYVSIKDLLNIS
jgi:hypothetical protein